MTPQIDILFNQTDRSGSSDRLGIAALQALQDVFCFHQSLPGYRPTPLVALPALASHLGGGKIWIKDESKRFDLNAFKVLGASWAMARAIASAFNMDSRDLTFDSVIKHTKMAQPMTFVTATDGNHGRAVAWSADKFGCRAVVYMPKGTSKTRLDAIRQLGAQASILDCNYDEAVVFAEKQALQNNWILMQDTAWKGYEKIPMYIMQGYCTLLTEFTAQEKGGWPTHVFVQAGVGSFAAAVSAFFCSCTDKPRPVFVLVEAQGAPCFYKSIQINDGRAHTVGGDLETIMAGLACGKPSRTGWEILKSGADAFAVCSDEVAEKGMRILGNPLADDRRVISGESGAVTLGLVNYLLSDKTYGDAKTRLNLDQNSQILLFSTEGDTDPDNYRKIVW